MTIPSPNVIVYTEDYVVTPASLASLQALYPGKLDSAIEAADVAKAGFDTVIVGLFHVHDDGSIYYNDLPVDSSSSADIREGIAALKTDPNSTVKKVLISFGGGNWAGHPASVSDSDYPNMKANWATFQPALLSLIEDCGADGVDWDYEPVTTPFDTGFIIQITNEIAAAPYLVTAAPYTDQSDWLTVIEGTAGESGPGNNFAWWGLQLYSGIPDYGNWVQALQGVSTGMSSNQVEAFVVPGYSPFCGVSPADDIAALKTAYPSLNGAFIWNYSQISACASDMASSIRDVWDPGRKPLNRPHLMQLL